MTSQRQPFLSLHLILGGVIGLITAGLTHYQVKPNFYLIYIQIFGILFLLASPNKRSNVRLVTSSLLCALLATLPIYYWQTLQNSTIIMLIALLNAYAINAFHIAYYTNKKWLYYSGLFFAVWNTFIDLIIASIFTLLIWTLIYLCSALLTLLQIDINPIIESPWFSYIVTCTAFSTGLFISLVAREIVQNIRKIILLISKFTLPIIAFISLTFFIGWLATMHSLSEIRLSTPIVFISMSFFSIILINGVYQKGNIRSPYPSIIAWLIKIFIITTPIYSALALYFFINDNKFNYSVNTVVFVNIGLLITYNLTYAVLALFSLKNWITGLKKANIGLAFILILTTLTTNNPWFYTHFKLKSSPKQNPKISYQKQFIDFMELLKKNSFTWIPPQSNITALNIGPATRPVFLCKGSNTEQIGFTNNKNQCVTINKYHAFKTKQFDILSGNKGIIWMNDSFYNITSKDRLFITGYTELERLSLCRAIYRNTIHYGIRFGYQCHIIDDHQVKMLTGCFQILYLNMDAN